MNYTAHPSTLNDGEVSFKEKQYLLPKYQKIARDNIGALDTAQVLELIKEHGGEGVDKDIEYFTAHDSSSYWANYTSTSLITKMLTVDQSKGNSISLYKEESGYTALYLNKGLYYLHCEIEYHNSPSMTGFFSASTWGGAGYPFEYRTSEMFDLSKSVLHIAPFDAVILIDRDHTALSLSNNFISDDGSMYRFINRLQIYKLPSATIEGGSGDKEYVDSKVATEAQNRETADLNLQNQLNDEITIRDSMDSELHSLITDEQIARENADTQLQTAINSEQTARVNDISALQANKQDKLIAGSGISIVNNVISSTGGGGGGSIGWQTSHLNNDSGWTLIDSEIGTKLNLYASHQGNDIMIGVRNKWGNQTGIISTMYPVCQYYDGQPDNNFSVYFNEVGNINHEMIFPLTSKGIADNFCLLYNYVTFKVMPIINGGEQFMPFTLDVYSYKERNDGSIIVKWRVL